MGAPEIVGMEWEDEFLPYFAEKWEPSQHVAIIAPTGQGKTTFLCGILQSRKYVLALDPKGGDQTLAATGFPRLARWPPPRKAYDAMNEGEPYRVRVGPVVQTEEDLLRLREVQRLALKGVFTDGGWTLAIDEFQVLADRRFMNLGAEAEKLLIAARNKGVSVVTLFQAPRWVPKAASDQATWIAIGLTQDTDVINRVAEILGRPKEDIRGAVRGLGSREFSWIVSHQNPRFPLIVTVPTKARLPRQSTGG